MKKNQLILFIVLCIHCVGISAFAKSSRNLKFTFIASAKDTQPKYLRFLRYQELMSLPEAKQLQYIAGVQKIFADLVKAHPRFALNELNQEQSPAMKTLLELMKKYPQLSLIMSEAQAQSTSGIRNAGAPVLIGLDNTAGGNPNKYYNDFVQFLTKNPPSQRSCSTLRVGDQTLELGIIEVSFRNVKRYVCATAVPQGAACPEGFQEIEGVAVSASESQGAALKPCGKVTQGKTRLLPMQPTDTNPDRPTRATNKPTPTPQPPRPTTQQSGGQSGLDGSIPLPPPPPPQPPPQPSTTPAPQQATTTPRPSPTPSVDMERSNYEAAARKTSVTQFPPDCSQEVYACQFGDEARSAARQAFQQDLSERDNNCINGANISKYSATAQKCSRVSSQEYGNETFSCSGNNTLCNPLIFGVLSDNKDPICVPLQMNVTLACSTAATQLGGGNPAANALKFLKANPAMADAWNKWTQSLEKLCQPGTDRNSHRFHCTECTLIFTHLQKLNALTGYTNACGNLLSSLGEGDPMIVNAIVDKSLSGVMGRNPQTPSTTPATAAPVDTSKPGAN